MRSSTKLGTCEESQTSWTSGPRAFRALFNHDTSYFSFSFSSELEQGIIFLFSFFQEAFEKSFLDYSVCTVCTFLVAES